MNEMQVRSRKSAWWLAMAAALILLLPLLAFLQYRWIGQLSRAERERMQANLRTASEHFAQEFDREVMRAALAFHANPPGLAAQGWDHFVSQYEDWRQTAPRPALIRTLWAAETGEGDEFRLFRLDPEAGRFEPAARPHRFPELGGGRPFGWTVSGEVPALVLSIPQTPARENPQRGRAPAWSSRTVAYLIVELDRDYIAGEFLPELARRHFAGPDGFVYHVAVVGKDEPGRAVYQSDPATQLAAFSSPDASADLLALRAEDAHAFSLAVPEAGAFTDGASSPGWRRSAGFRFRAFQPGAEGEWRMLARHSSGSVEAAVAGFRARNLGISFAILLLLGAGVGTVLLAARRAQNLARLQMEFVAGISHELLTPLAVIHSAGDNLADGTVTSAEQMRRYGEVIRNEGRRLSDMVRETLDFATAQSRRKREEFGPVDVSELIPQAVESCCPAGAQNGLELVQEIAPGLPPVMGDSRALSLCLRNLISNAWKYAREGGYIEIRAQKIFGRRGPGVEISVSDRGPGIHPTDLPHIFDPFYRGRDAAASSAHGAGLGLSLVKRVVEEHGGTVSVKSVSGAGSTFTIRLPTPKVD